MNGTSVNSVVSYPQLHPQISSTGWNADSVRLQFARVSSDRSFVVLAVAVDLPKQLARCS